MSTTGLEEGEEVIHGHLDAAREAAFSNDFRSYSKAWKKFRQALPKGHWLKKHSPESPSEAHMKQIAHGPSSVTSVLHPANNKSRIEDRMDRVVQSLNLINGSKSRR